MQMNLCVVLFQRDYYKALIDQWVIRAVEELEFIEGMERFCLWYLRLSLLADL